MKKIELIDWIYNAQNNLDTRGRDEFGSYKKYKLKAMKLEELQNLKGRLEGALYATGVRSESRMHRFYSGFF